MASRLLRRSGVAVGLVADAIGWRADTVIQVGVGLYHQEVDVLKAEWPGLRWYGVDPHPGVAEAVAREGKFDLFVGAAASDYSGKEIFYLKRHHADGSSLLPVPGGVATEVTVERLDDMFWAIASGEVDPGRLLLWIDVEGFEVEALCGAPTLLQMADAVNVELTGKAAAGWSDPCSVDNVMAAAGFWPQWQHTNRITLGQRDVIYVKARLFRPELCCFPEAVRRWRRYNG